MNDTNQDSSNLQATNKQTPDEPTKDRIKNLAVVGTAINQMSGGEISFDTNYFVAKEALNKFMIGIDNLDLDPASHKGMVDLVMYLQKKIDKRMKNSNTQNQKPLT